MKTAEEWFNELVARPKYQSDCNAIISQGTIMQIQADAQKHGEQIGWKRGMSEAAIMMEKGLQTENSGVKYWGNISELKTHEAILAARDSKNKL